MIEPVSYSVSELAQRWGVTQRQILDMALELRVPLHFNFDGLAFNVADEWHRHGGDYFVSNELTNLTTSIKNSEEWLKRHARGQTGEYDSLSDDEVRELRAGITKNQRKADELKDKLEARERGRRHAEYRGIVRVPPLTLLEIMEHGETDVPRRAFHSDSPIKVVQVPAREYGGAAGLAWEGAMLALEPYSRPWGKLTADSLFALAVEVKAIEAHQKTKDSPQARPAPASAPEASGWVVHKPERLYGYSVPLYLFLAKAHREGKPRPTARDVVEAWRQEPPAEIAQVLPDSVDYYDSKGNTKAADLDAIGKAIARMLKGR